MTEWLPRSPTISLVALTPETREAIGSDSVIVEPLPYRVGRESRLPGADGERVRVDQRRPGTPRTNDLYLVDTSEHMNVSREHFQIEWTSQGVVLVDRGSTCGTLVEGRQIGGDGEGGMAPLEDGHVIIVGTGFSPFVFKVRVAYGARD